MQSINYSALIKEHNLSNLLKLGNFGIEKENLRTDLTGNLALTDFPIEFGNKLNNPYITVDFSESQIEMITPTFQKLEEAYNFLQNLNDIVTTTLKNEYLWPQSIPCILPDETLIPIAKFDGEYGIEVAKYRKKLAEKYGKKLQLLSGIHFNFSFSEDLLKSLYSKANTELSFIEFKNEFYLKTTRNFFKTGWLIIYLLGASSTIHKTYRKECTNLMNPLGDDLFYFENAVSFRNGRCGYKNKDEFFVSHNSLNNYISDLENLVEKGILNGAREYYSPIRLKSKDPKNILNSLKTDGVHYLEIRSIDINPFNPNGIELLDLKFIHMLLIYFALKEEDTFSEEDYDRYLKNQELIANEGRNSNLNLICCKNTQRKITTYTLELIEEIKNLFESLNILGEEEIKILDFQKKKVKNPENLYVNKLINEVKNKGFIEFNLEMAKKHLKVSQNRSFALKGYEDLELSTQILLKEAIKRGVKFELIDREENFLYLNKENNQQYVKQATKTSLDSYITVLIMENKVVTKKVLSQKGICVPSGNNYSKEIDAINDFYKYKEKEIVIKPKSTNFGLGISIFKNSFTKAEYNEAISLAFKEDNSILIEEFIKGKEYRFFVIGDEVVGILHRVPANIVGNGVDTIRELVKIKNLSPLRGKGYKTPLEKIGLGDLESLFLSNQGKDFDYIPKEKEVVYLRENSNISTGGDSIDYTDNILPIYKNIAVQAAKAANATICGVDMMIQDLNNKNPEGNYSIIEINFNPAIHIHCYPYIGKDRKIGAKLLDALGY
ncbi:bifunctional glutamate--cysteine ligase GshA/glutathione synthetase GshB [uncultured Cetobacterium sp.]|uniref:bifunctional glutamate--cysteine ligase GshA/glutathione synthetase GshB n=1 Tax=uncultured Cetobacterium sp. TaxID=527638 RepID=UPI0026189DD2|nr:bifunctional glutamate--cysteine ligase GshA/glutathione synthetase GshB [uncultured Cetobacterium sp.]